MRLSVLASFLVVSWIAALLQPAVLADVPRVLPQGKVPADARLAPPKTLDGYFPLVPPKSRDEWQHRSEQVRRQMLVSQGLWPMPTKTPANAVVHGLVDRPDYTVERVFLESYPGHFVTGSLFRPKGKSGKLPGVLCPHGHWANGRFYDAGRKTVRQQIVDGAERFEESGRYPLQARCVQLARMGCVVFHYDMEGVADCKQLSSELVHGFKAQRPHMNTADNWGFYSPQAELHLQNIMGLQTYNSVRVLDWFSELPDVDATRIGVTGASGGGTQTFMLGAIDPRPAVAFPAVMVSTAMQGGCTCENACCLRVDTGNIEFAGLFAPRPLGMTGADDWTIEIATKGLPELKQLYKLLGDESLVMARPLNHFGHNYNHVSRAVMYSWFNKHLKLGAEEPVVEQDFKPLSIAELTVWNDSHPAPPAGDDHERQLVRWMTEDAQKQIERLTPRDDESLAEYRRVVGGALEAIVGHGLPDPQTLQHEMVAETDRGDYLETKSLLRSKEHGQELPILFLHPKQWNKRVVLWIDEAGKSGLYDDSGNLRPEVQKVLKSGATVAGIDLLYQGEFNREGKPPAKNRRVPNDREYAGYTYGYNHPLLAQRVHDVLALASFVKNHVHKPEQVQLVGLDGAGPVVAIASAMAGDAITGSAIDTGGFRFAGLTAFDDANFLPGVVKYGDIPGILALCADRPLWLTGEGSDAPQIVRSAFSAGKRGELVTFGGTEDAEADAVVDWLLK